MMNSDVLGFLLDEIYHRYNKRTFVAPDPLQFLYNYKDIRDREIAGLIASSLAYGRVQQICKSVDIVLKTLKKPLDYIKKSSLRTTRRDLDGFKHRFTKPADIAMLLAGVKKIIAEYGSIENCFKSGISGNDDSVIPALAYFVHVHSMMVGDRVYYLLPSPKDGSACKRLNLYLKWMVRNDNVDPGGWSDISPSILIFPVDTHIRKICYNLGLSRRNTADLKSAVEITDAFRRFDRDDPTKYDFALTRMGMWDKQELEKFYSKCGAECVKSDVTESS
jgi:uncharacterized protein (TIGR02757 family)